MNHLHHWEQYTEDVIHRGIILTSFRTLLMQKCTECGYAEKVK